ncbi:hypothetical protein P9A16_30600 [Shinella sp. 838]|jgi:hypothetical protein|uniref:hypothetical protein n=1 Tax=unclassified Shinella TaxID=2643062 RepID=UPI0003C5327E|nr:MULTISPECIES: hypothetical protein [unclassified Shinella]EYR81002.1 hypothetical protein SHLA_54c000300 [Shinella sp. DD12]MCA0340666.1 hypothetical protein [Pseudomonadota bacterium]MDG4675470.1 hypothetical protein [Shinella sp. 838]
MASYSTGVSDVGIESNVPALAWGPVIGGATAAAAITLILLLLGSGVGLTMVSPWSGESASFTTVSVTAAIWFVIVQWLSSALGGYLTGRLRTKWAGIHTDEVFFRDTAHGFLSWALATVVVAGLAGSAFTSLVGSGVQAASSVAATASVGATAATAGGDEAPDLATGYFTDLLLRPQDAAARAQSDDAAATAEVSRILMQGAAKGEVPEADRAYVATIVASRAGIPQEEARTRVDQVLQQIEDAKNTALQAADDARKSAATVALLGALSLLVGAFVASAAAALGGRQRDDDEAALVAKA